MDERTIKSIEKIGNAMEEIGLLVALLRFVLGIYTSILAVPFCLILIGVVSELFHRSIK